MDFKKSIKFSLKMEKPKTEHTKGSTVMDTSDNNPTTKGKTPKTVLRRGRSLYQQIKDKAKESELMAARDLRALPSRK